jgi:phage-related protein
MPRALIVEVIGNTAGFTRALDEAAGRTSRFGAAMKLVGATAAGALAVGLEKSIKAGENLKASQNSLHVALGHVHANATALEPKFNDLARSSAKYGISQTQATTALARATLLTGNAKDAMIAYKEAQVISAATGKDLNSVVTAASKALEGHTSSLSRYGIYLSKSATSQEQFNTVMGRFAGQAAANTTAGEKLHANFQNLEATIGEALLPAFEKLVAGLNDAVVWVQKNWPGFETGVANVFDTVKNDVTAFIDVFTQTIPNAFQSVLDWVTGHWRDIATFISGPFAPIVALATNAFGVRTKLVDAFKDVVNFVKDHWGDIVTLISGPFAPLVALATNAFGVRSALLGAFGDVVSFA